MVTKSLSLTGLISSTSSLMMFTVGLTSTRMISRISCSSSPWILSCSRSWPLTSLLSSVARTDSQAGLFLVPTRLTLAGVMTSYSSNTSAWTMTSRSARTTSTGFSSGLRASSMRHLFSTLRRPSSAHSSTYSSKQDSCESRLPLGTLLVDSNVPYLWIRQRSLSKAYIR